MPESRERLSRSENVAATFSLRRRSIGGMGVLADVPEIGTGTPFRWGETPMTGTSGSMGVAGSVRLSLGTPRVGHGRGRNLYASPAFGRENTPSGSGRRGRWRGRQTSSVLPSWYPRKPLNDITAIVRAIERRRARLREIEGQQLENPIPQDQSVPDPSVSISGAQLEHESSIFSQNSTTGTRPSSSSVSEVSKILLDITSQNTGKPDFLTPQKVHLNSIDTVQKVVMEELDKSKKTPTAKKAERAKRVRTLMSMR